MKRPLLWWPFLVVFAAASAMWLTVQDSDAAIRPLVTFGFLLFCPGLAFVRWLHLGNVLAECVLALALSASLDAAVAMLMLYSGNWSPADGVVVVGMLTIAAVLFQFAWPIARRRAPSRRPGPQTG